MLMLTIRFSNLSPRLWLYSQYVRYFPKEINQNNLLYLSIQNLVLCGAQLLKNTHILRIIDGYEE